MEDIPCQKCYHIWLPKFYVPFFQLSSVSFSLICFSFERIPVSYIFEPRMAIKRMLSGIFSSIFGTWPIPMELGISAVKMKEIILCNNKKQEHCMSEHDLYYLYFLMKACRKVELSFNASIVERTTIYTSIMLWMNAFIHVPMTPFNCIIHS